MKKTKKSKNTTWKVKLLACCRRESADSPPTYTHVSKNPLATNGRWWNHREALPGLEVGGAPADSRRQQAAVAGEGGRQAVPLPTPVGSKRVQQPTKSCKKTITISVRLKPEEHEVLQRLCRLKNITQTACLADLATHSRQEKNSWLMPSESMEKVGHH
jgi:hypothetical protein